MLNLFKKLLGKSEAPASPVPRVVARATPQAAPESFQPAPQVPQVPQVEVAHLSLSAIIGKLPEDLKRTVARMPDANATVALPIATIHKQLPTGSVKMSLASLYRQSPAGTFSQTRVEDRRMVEVPLSEIFRHVNPRDLQKRDQRPLEVPEDAIGLFGDSSNPFALAPGAPSTPAPQARAIPTPQPRAIQPPTDLSPTPTARPISPAVAKPVAPRAVAPPPAFANTPAAAAPSDEPPLVLPLAQLAEQWPEPIRSEALALNGATVSLPAAFVTAGLAKGKVTFSWGQIRAWISPAVETPSAAGDHNELVLPLKVVAPAFLALSRPKTPRKTFEMDPTIPALFSGGNPPPPAEAPAAEAPAVEEAAPAPEETAEPAAPEPAAEAPKVLAPPSDLLSSTPAAPEVAPEPEAVAEPEVAPEPAVVETPTEEVQPEATETAEESPEAEAKPIALVSVEAPKEEVPTEAAEESEAIEVSGESQAETPEEAPEAEAQPIALAPVEAPKEETPAEATEEAEAPKASDDSEVETPVEVPAEETKPTVLALVETPKEEAPVEEKAEKAEAPAAAAEPIASVPKPGTKAPFTLGEILGDSAKTEWTPTELVRGTVKLDGVAGAVIALQEGLLVAAELPEPMKGDTVAAFLPQIFARLSNYAGEMQLGPVEDVLFTSNGCLFQIYRVGEVYFAVLAKQGEKLPWESLRLIAEEAGGHHQK